MQRLLDCSKGVVVTVLLLVMVVVVVRRCDAALQSGGQVTEVCNGNRLLGNCSTVGGALSVQLGMGGERRKEMKGELAKGESICSGTCCSPELQGRLTKVARNELHVLLSEQMRKLLPQCQAVEPAALARDISAILSDYIAFQTQLVLGSVCTVNTLAYGFEEFATSIGNDDLLAYTKEEILRLYFNVMVDYFNYRIQNPYHYQCVRKYVMDSFGEQVDLYTKQAIVFLAKLQLLLRTSQEMSTLYRYLSSNSKWLSSSCANKLTTMTYCRICSGYVCFKPCRSFCIDTVVGCLTRVTDVLGTTLQEALTLLQVVREDVLNSTGALLRLASHLHQGYLSHLEENAEEVHMKLRQCQNWKRTGERTVKQSDLPEDNSEPRCHAAYKNFPSHVPDLEVQLNEVTMRWFNCFAAKLPALTTLATSICLEKEYSGREYQEWNCWNGTHLGRYNKQAEVPVEERNVLLFEKQSALSLVVWRAARALEALNSCTNSTQCIAAYAQSLNLIPVMNSSEEDAIVSKEENGITAHSSPHQWFKPPQLVLRPTANPHLPNSNSTSGTGAPVSPVTSSGASGVSSTGQCAAVSRHPWWLLLTCIILHHFL